MDEAKKRPYLNESHRGANSNARKNKAWDEIAKSLSALGVANRTPKECRKKLQGLRSSVKSKAAEISRTSRKTGGGPPPLPLTSFENTVLDLVPSTSYEGVEGGVDTSLPAIEETPEYKETPENIEEESMVETPLAGPASSPESTGASGTATPSAVSKPIVSTNDSIDEAITLQKENNALLQQLLDVLLTVAADVKDIKDQFAKTPVYRTL